MGLVAFGDLAAGETGGRRRRQLDSVTEAMLQASAAQKQRDVPFAHGGSSALGTLSGGRVDPLAAKLAGLSRSLRPYT